MECNIGWKDVPVVELLAEQLPVPIHTANNTDCAVLGEMAAGAVKGGDDVLMLTVGRGVGSGLVHSGQLYDGTEFGHMVIEEDGRTCSCGRKGCLEAYVSVTALRKKRKKSWGLLWSGKNCGRQPVTGMRSRKNWPKAISAASAQAS